MKIFRHRTCREYASYSAKKNVGSAIDDLFFPFPFPAFSDWPSRHLPLLSLPPRRPGKGPPFHSYDWTARERERGGFRLDPPSSGEGHGGGRESPGGRKGGGEKDPLSFLLLLPTLFNEANEGGEGGSPRVQKRGALSPPIPYPTYTWGGGRGSTL